MTTVLLGNPAPVMQVRKTSVDEQGNPVEVWVSEPALHLNQSVTSVDMREDFADPEHVELTLSTDNDRMLIAITSHIGDEHRPYAVGVNELEQIWGAHCAGGRPAYVECDDPAFAAALAAWFNCPVGEPTALLTSVGRDALHGQHIATAAQPAAFSYMAVSANATAASTASTTLPGEITTASGGLLRAQGTVAHTVGTNTTTLTKTFTANGSDSLPVVIAKLGVLNAASVGTLGYETLLNATATLTVSGDSVAITETLTAG